jgi:hypothetical protein
MAKQIINVGARNNDGTGDSLRVGATKVNDNFSEIYNLLGDGESLSVVSRINAGQGLTVSNSTGLVLITGTIASNNDLGMIKIGENLTISQDGTLSAQQTTYTLPTASSTVLGGVKVGTGLSINQGVLSANNPTPYTLPIATSSIRGGVKVGANLSVTADGTISGHPDYLLPTATDSILGGIKIGAGLSISQGTVSVTGTSNSSDRLVSGNSEFVLTESGSPGNAPTISGPLGININSTNGKQLGLNWTAAAIDPYPGVPELGTTVALVNLDYGGVIIEVNSAGDGSYWTFGPTGALVHSQGSATRTKSILIENNITTQVVWTGRSFTSGAKLTIQVECAETSGVNGNSWETQVCEAIVAVRGYNTASVPVISVYGVTHTSAAPLMTFTVDRNPVSNLIEIVGTRTATASPLGQATLTIYSVETRTND